MAKGRYVGQYLVVIMLVIAAMIFMSISSYNGPMAITGMAGSQVGNLSTTITSYVSCSASDAALNVSFGSTSPGDIVNATLNYYGTMWNYTSYNVTNDAISNVPINITIKGADLLSGANLIGVTNVSWINGSIGNATGMQYANKIVLTTTDNAQYKVAAFLPRTNSSYIRFWISIPSGQSTGTYSGNYTMTCSQAS